MPIRPLCRKSFVLFHCLQKIRSFLWLLVVPRHWFMLSGISGSLPCSGNSSYCWWNLKRNDSAFVHRQLIDFHKRQPLIFSIHMNRYYLSTFQSKSASPPLHEIIPYFSDSSNGTIVNVFPIDTSSFKMVDNWGSVFRFPFSQSQTA